MRSLMICPKEHSRSQFNLRRLRERLTRFRTGRSYGTPAQSDHTQPISFSFTSQTVQAFPRPGRCQMSLDLILIPAAAVRREFGVVATAAVSNEMGCCQVEA